MSIQKKNMIVADQLMIMADLESLSGEKWSPRAYKKAANTVLSLDIPIDTVGDLKSLSGVGSSISDAIMEIIKSGTCKKLEALKLAHKNGVDSRALLVVPGIGVKTALKLYEQGITSLEELEKACDSGKVKTASIKRGIKLALKTQGRIPIYEALPIVTPLLNEVRKVKGVFRAEFVGSISRGKETIKDVDILVLCDDRSAVIDKFLEHGEELIRGEQKARIIVPINSLTSVQVDLLFTERESWGAASMYFTGSKEHNIALRTRANTLGFTLNEYGLTKKEGNVFITGEKEADIYAKLNLPWHPQELREGDDLIEEPDASKINNLVSKEDINSDWHMHSTYSSDAKNSIMEMAVAAKKGGLKAIGITDHVEVQYKWMPADIDKRISEANEASKATGIKVYAGAEVGVNVDGTLVDRIDLDKQDYLIASIHRSHSTDTVERLISAAKDSRVKIIGHPTGRLLGRRDIPDEDWDKLFKVCVAEKVLLEINGPRLDLPVYLIKRAKAIGCKFVINSDAHAVEHLGWSQFSLMLARRAGLTNEDLDTPF